MAGIFGFLDPTRPGKGVKKDEPGQSHFKRFFIITQRKFWKLIQLNLLFLLFSLPIVTIGPSAAAMTRVLRDYANERPVFLFSDFWDAFKSNFKQSFVCGLIFTAAVIMLSVAWQFYYTGASQNTWMYIPLVIVIVISLLFVFCNFYVWLLIVTIDLPLKAILKNSFLFAVLGMKSNLATLLFGAITIFGLWYIYMLGYLLYLIIGFAFIGLIIVHNCYRVIKKYAIDPNVEQSGTNDENVFTDEFIGENESEN